MELRPWEVGVASKFRLPSLPDEIPQTAERPWRVRAESRRQHGLVGREREFSAVLRFIERSSRSGGTLVVRGEAGVGRSALIETAVRTTEDSALLLRAAGFPAETEIDFAGMHQLMLPVAHTLSAVAEPHRRALSTALGLGADDGPGEILLVSSLLAWLRHLSEAAPVIISFDDVHLTDRSSARVLSLLARRLDGTRVGMILSHRSDTAIPLDEPWATRLELGPLGRLEADALLRRERPHLHPAVRRRIVDVAGGNPLALVELPRGLTSGQEYGSESIPEALPMNDRLHRLFAERVQGLPQSTREFLLCAALNADDGVQLEQLAAGAMEDLARAEERQLIQLNVSEQRIWFSNLLTRTAVIELATAPERRAAHARLASLATNERVRARHRVEASIGFDDDAAAERAAEARTALERGDVVDAVALLVRSAELTVDRDERARRLAEAAFLGAQVSGSMVGAEAMLQRARFVNPDAMRTLHSATAAASHLVNSEGGVEAAHSMLLDALDATSPGEVDATSAESAISTLMFICTFGGRDDLWSRFMAVVYRFANRLPRVLLIAATTLVDPARATAGHLRELDAIVSHAESDTNPMRALQAAAAGHYVDRIPRRALQRLADDARAGGAIATGASAMILLSEQAFAAGRWDDAQALADESIRLCEEQGLESLRWASVNARRLVAAGRAEHDDLERARGEMLAWASTNGVEAAYMVMANIDANAALGEGRFQDAYDALLRIGRPGTFQLYRPLMMWTVLDVVEACLGSARPDQARRHVGAAADLGLMDMSPRLRVLCAVAEAEVSSDEECDLRFNSLLSDPELLEWPFQLARAELCYGDRLRHGKEIRRARTHLERSLELFMSLKATAWSERALASLRATGQSRRRATPFVGAMLTPQEAEVAQLAASGMSNKQIGERLFLSARTVSGHLYRAFPKLGITSRAALRDALTAREMMTRK